MHHIPPTGCYKLPPAPPSRPTAEGGEEGREPDLLTHLTARVRLWIVAGWLPPEEAT